MGKMKSARAEVHYFSSLLKRKLEKMLAASATVVEAPSGYGKSTAVRDFLEGSLDQSTPMYWFTSADEEPAAGYSRFCRQVEQIDRQAGERLLRIGLPNAATIGETIAALRSLRCPYQAYLVIDNFHYLHSALPAAFLTALMEHGGECLHIIVITQMLKRSALALVAGHGFLHLTAADLRLGAEDIRRYFDLAGAHITPEEARELERYTEGWIVALYLQLRSFLERGSFSDRPGILTLMERLLWDCLQAPQQDFLLRISPFKVVTLRQACYLLDCAALPAEVLEALGSPFIRLEPAEGRYELHAILSDLLVQKRGERGAAFERDCLLRAGDFCREDGQTAAALEFYAQAGDYERMLSLDLSPLILETVNGKPFAELARDIALNCPQEIKRSHPLSLLRLAYALYTAGMNEEFALLMEELRSAPDQAGGERDPALIAEWTLLDSLKNFPRTEEMIPTLRKTAALFGAGRSRVLLPASPWCLGNHSPISFFYTRPGEADRKADELEEYLALYAPLTGGHGSGADVLFRAELAFQRGEIGEAEILSYKAVFLAESNGQNIVHLGATALLAQIALHKADTAGWQRAIGSMERAAPGTQDTFISRATLDITRAVLLNELEDQGSIPQWLQKGDFSGRRLTAPIVIPAHFVHLSYLMHQGEFARVVGTGQAMLLPRGMGSPFVQALITLVTAVGQIGLGYRDRAAELVEHAAALALPDGLVFPFAAYSWLLQDLPEKVIGQKYPHLLQPYHTIRNRFYTGWTTLREAIYSGELPADLTERESEVARLAAAGLFNAEIAEKLVITESTVRTHLRTVFKKLHIDRRSRLAERIKFP